MSFEFEAFLQQIINHIELLVGFGDKMQHVLGRVC